jgi:hypothetical protein
VPTAASPGPDRSVAAAEVFRAGVPEQAMVDAADEPAMVAVVERFLRASPPSPQHTSP